MALQLASSGKESHSGQGIRACACCREHDQRFPRLLPCLWHGGFRLVMGRSKTVKLSFPWGNETGSGLLPNNLGRATMIWMCSNVVSIVVNLARQLQVDS